MAKRTKSALKANRQNIKRREHNRQMRSRLRSALKSIRASLDSKDLDGAKAALRATVRKSSTNAALMPTRNTARRYNSRLGALRSQSVGVGGPLRDRPRAFFLSSHNSTRLLEHDAGLRPRDLRRHSERKPRRVDAVPHAWPAGPFRRSTQLPAPKHVIGLVEC